MESGCRLSVDWAENGIVFYFFMIFRIAGWGKLGQTKCADSKFTILPSYSSGEFMVLELKGTGTRDLIWLKVVSLERS